MHLYPAIVILYTVRYTYIHIYTDYMSYDLRQVIDTQFYISERKYWCDYYYDAYFILKNGVEIFKKLAQSYNMYIAKAKIPCAVFFLRLRCVMS